MKNDLYDVTIIGGGPAAHSAALYSRRKELKTAMIAKEEGGQLLYSSEIDNYLGVPDVEGFELVKKFRGHVDKYEPDKLEDEVLGIEKEGSEFVLSLKKGEELETKTLIVATGAKWRKLDVPGEKELTGKGLSYCTTCDGPLFADADVAVIGGGNSAFEGIIDLLPIANRIVNVDIAPEPIADPVLQRHVKESDHRQEVELEKYYGHEILEILGNDMVTGLRIRDKNSGEEKEVEIEGIFVEIGLIPNSQIVEDLVEINDAGEIVVDCNSQTTVDGLFAAGDVTNVPEKQIIIAAGEGAKAALGAYRYLIHQ
ncbi:FAD-dependent oxidoreductase [Candidatus Bipolaricaulota bacterium]|nr:FAD-dependent oxidoreductase [Candidatus Bipolaricaulota bacterium]